MNHITLSQLLPDVFAEASDEPRIVASQVWMHPEVTFSRGESVLVEAASGMGKSSLVAFVYGMRADYGGRIAFDDRDIRSLSRADWCDVRRGQLAYLPQELQLFPELSAIDNINLKNSLTRHRSARWISDAMERLSIGELSERPVGRMSVGQQQRVALLRALCQPFSFLLLDEPVSHLDAASNRAAATLVADAAAEAGAGVIVTSVGNPLQLSYTATLSL